MNNLPGKILVEIKTWPGIAMHRYDRTVALEFHELRFAMLHDNGHLAVLFAMATRDHLVSSGRALAHPMMPATGWVSYVVSTPADTNHALWLLRLGYLHKCLLIKAECPMKSEGVAAEMDSLRLEPGLRRTLTQLGYPV